MKRTISLIMFLCFLLPVSCATTAPAQVFEPQTMQAEENVVAAQVESKMDINTATMEQLLSVPGIGRVKAGVILIYLKEAPATSMEELTAIWGVGLKTVSRLAEYFEVKETSESVIWERPVKAVWGFVSSFFSPESAQAREGGSLRTWIDLNNANMNQLMSLGQLSLEKANAVCMYRDAYGFGHMDELDDVPGITERDIYNITLFFYVP